MYAGWLLVLTPALGFAPKRPPWKSPSCFMQHSNYSHYEEWYLCDPYASMTYSEAEDVNRGLHEFISKSENIYAEGCPLAFLVGDERKILRNRSRLNQLEEILGEDGSSRSSIVETLKLLEKWRRFVPPSLMIHKVKAHALQIFKEWGHANQTCQGGVVIFSLQKCQIGWKFATNSSNIILESVQSCATKITDSFAQSEEEMLETSSDTSLERTAPHTFSYKFVNMFLQCLLERIETVPGNNDLSLPSELVSQQEPDDEKEIEMKQSPVPDEASGDETRGAEHNAMASDQQAIHAVVPLSVDETTASEPEIDAESTVQATVGHAAPTTHPTHKHPTQAPIPTPHPSPHPTSKPTHPTPKPTNHPTGPTKQPTNYPTQPTPHPTDFPTFQPTKVKIIPTSSPTAQAVSGLTPGGTANPDTTNGPTKGPESSDDGQNKPALWRRWAWVCVPMLVIIVFGLAVFSSGWGQDSGMAWGAHGAAWGRPDTIRKMGGVYEKSALHDSKEPDYVTFARETHSSRTQWRDMNYKRWHAEQTNSEGYGLADDGFYYRTDDYALSDPVVDERDDGI
mmetsp:Transcript_33003/g.63729  ORF Transcript_33003/g.63729 Transcript_33003/m.63729 type:complete len:566 (+) Transcript_33003:41-1738(+)